MDKPLLKVCCISSVSEAKLALEKGADYLGLVGPMPSGPGILSLEQIKDIVQSLPSDTKTILLTSDADATTIANTVKNLGVYAVQIVRELPVDTLTNIRKLLPDTVIFSVVHVVDENSINVAKSYQEIADFILLDSGKPAKGILGGTGAVHNWDYSRRIVEELSTPVFLAGGLNPGNVESAIDSVNPFGLDLCSGLRTNDKLDPEKLNDFVEKLS
jgi:phosphoribosylanthranilate isomerase